MRPTTSLISGQKLLTGHRCGGRLFSCIFHYSSVRGGGERRRARALAPPPPPQRIYGRRGADNIIYYFCPTKNGPAASDLRRCERVYNMHTPRLALRPCRRRGQLHRPGRRGPFLLVGRKRPGHTSTAPPPPSRRARAVRGAG